MKAFYSLCALGLVLSLSGCGLKYDLYLPQPQSVQNSESENASADQSQLTLFDNSDNSQAEEADTKTE